MKKIVREHHRLKVNLLGPFLRQQLLLLAHQHVRVQREELNFDSLDVDETWAGFADREEIAWLPL